MEHTPVPTEKKIQWVRELAATGLDVLQVGSFVHPTKVPQMADTDELFRQLMVPGMMPPSVVLSGLVLNEKGLERGLTCGVPMFCMGVSASETHSKKNTGMSVSEATDRILAMGKLALQENRSVQVSVQSAFGCGYEGHVTPERVVSIVSRYIENGFVHISLADTAGHATPDLVETLFTTISKLDGAAEFACHFHNTYGMAIANCLAARRAGVRSFESSVAGLGGCPFTKVAGGNVCTEDFVHMLHRMGMRTDVRLEGLIAVAQDVASFFNREMPGMVYKTGPIRS